MEQFAFHGQTSWEVCQRILLAIPLSTGRRTLLESKSGELAPRRGVLAHSPFELAGVVLDEDQARVCGHGGGRETRDRPSWTETCPSRAAAVWWGKRRLLGRIAGETTTSVHRHTAPIN